MQDLDYCSGCGDCIHETEMGGIWCPICKQEISGLEQICASCQFDFIKNHVDLEHGSIELVE